MTKNVRTHNLSEPLNGTKTATVEINTDSGNLTIDRLTGGEQLLASGTLEYFEKQGLPTETLSSSNGQATLTLRGGGGRPWFRLLGQPASEPTSGRSTSIPRSRLTSLPTAVAATSS